jgi:GH18 family chitinase
MNLIRFVLILFISFAHYDETNAQGCPVLRSKKRLICYFASWAGNHRPSPANIQPEDFDPCMCTHVLYSFVNLRNSRLELTNTDRGFYYLKMTIRF